MVGVLRSQYRSEESLRGWFWEAEWRRTKIKECCCEKCKNVTVRVVGAAFGQQSGAWRVVWGGAGLGGVGWGALSQPLQGNWVQMWGSVAPAPARRQGRIKSSAQGWWDRWDRLSLCSPPQNTAWTQRRTSDQWGVFKPCSSSVTTNSSASWNVVIYQRVVSLSDLDFGADNVKSPSFSLQALLCLHRPVRLIFCHCAAAVVLALSALTDDKTVRPFLILAWRVSI